jgi:hypothetical protein
MYYNFYYILIKKMANNVILVTGSYDHTLVFWDALSGQ